MGIKSAVYNQERFQINGAQTVGTFDFIWQKLCFKKVHRSDTSLLQVKRAEILDFKAVAQGFLNLHVCETTNFGEPNDFFSFSIPAPLLQLQMSVPSMKIYLLLLTFL